MKIQHVLAPVLLLLSYLGGAQGTTCSNAIPITLDGIERSYTTSSSIGANVVCTSTSSSPITFFSFTTNAAGECPLLAISAPSGKCEIAMYTACNGGNALQTYSSMCFETGEGLWAPAHDYVLQANTQYILRIKTIEAGNIKIAGQHFKPSNNDCTGAFAIGSKSIDDNNACHTGGPIVKPDELCAYTLENTAFYAFTIENSGPASIYISNISCNNGPINNSNGFQIGFFTGSCNSLVPLNCTSGEGAAVIGTSQSLPAGTKVIVAIDGVSGSNCKYSISTTNAQPLSFSVNNFSGWKTPSSNFLKWTSKQEEPSVYEIQRSADGSQFITVGKLMQPKTVKENIGSFEDKQPLLKSFYRLKISNVRGEVTFTSIISVLRDEMPVFKVLAVNPVSHTLKLKVELHESEKFVLQLFDKAGVLRYTTKLVCRKGINISYQDISTLPDGSYLIQLGNDKLRYTGKFMKVGGINQYQ
jgi:hypothetical protein